MARDNEARNAFVQEILGLALEKLLHPDDAMDALARVAGVIIAGLPEADRMQNILAFKVTMQLYEELCRDHKRGGGAGGGSGAAASDEILRRMEVAGRG